MEGSHPQTSLAVPSQRLAQAGTARARPGGTIWSGHIAEAGRGAHSPSPSSGGRRCERFRQLEEETSFKRLAMWAEEQHVALPFLGCHRGKLPSARWTISETRTESRIRWGFHLREIYAAVLGQQLDGDQLPAERD